MSLLSAASHHCAWLTAVAVALWAYHAGSAGMLSSLAPRFAGLGAVRSLASGRPAGNSESAKRLLSEGAKGHEGAKRLSSESAKAAKNAKPRRTRAVEARPRSVRPVRFAPSPSSRFRSKNRTALSRAPQRAAHPAARPEPAVRYRKVMAAGVPLHVVQVDLSRPEVRLTVATARGGVGHRESWSAMIDRARPAAAITGTYFDVPSALPVGSIIAGGQLLCRGLVGTALTFSTQQGARLVACRPGQSYDWPHVETVLRAGPRLLTGGHLTVWPRDEGFRDPAIWARKRRTAVAITRHHKLLLVAEQRPIQLSALARALQTLGAVDAMCLDGGTSSGLYVHGKTWVQPARPLTNLLVVYDTPARYQAQLARLRPAAVQVVQSPLAPSAG